jgi:hypothetical protein
MSGRTRSVWQLGKAILVLAVVVALSGCTSSSATPLASSPTPTSEQTASAETTPSPAEATPTQSIAPTDSPTPAPSPTSPAAGCTGTADNQAFFVEAAAKLHFDVYCAVLPSGWWLQTGSYTLASGGFLQVEYKTAGAATFSLWEGAWCPPSKSCIAVGPLVGPASFDGLSGSLYLNSTTYTLRVGTVANPAYLMVGSGMTQAQFTALAAALIKVPTS